MAKVYVLDTSAIIALLEDESGAARVESLLKQAKHGSINIYISFITLAECYYICAQQQGEDAAVELTAYIKSLSVTVIESEEKLTLTAGQIKTANRLSLGDAFIAATASAVSGILVHKDPEFEQLVNSVQLENLPYKKPGKRH